MQWDVRLQQAIDRANGTSARSKNATVVLIDPARKIKGPGLPETAALVSFHQLTDSHEVLDIYRVSSSSSALLKSFVPTLETQATQIVVVIEFDWLAQRSAWPDLFRRVCACLGSLERVSFVFAVVNFVQVAEKLTSLNEECDICQQYLRTLAMAHNAPLIYENSDISWASIFAQAAFGTHRIPDTRLDESRLVVWPGDDSKLQIMAVNPAFDYDAAVKNELELPRVATPEPMVDADDDIEEIRLEDVIREAQQRSKYGDTQSGGHFDARKFEYSEEEDGKKTISEFFEYLVHKST